MKKRQKRFKSLSTPGIRQDASNYLVELAFLRANHGIKLRPKFWQQTKYKFRYRREIQAVRKFIKKYGEATVLSVAISNYIKTWTDYAQIEGLLQRVNEREKLKASTKDLTPVKEIVENSSPDLREQFGILKNKKINKGLFQKIKELKNEC